MRLPDPGSMIEWAFVCAVWMLLFLGAVAGARGIWDLVTR